MRTLFTTYDIKNIFKNIFTTNDKLSLYDNSNNFLKDITISDYLNIDFYAWKNRLVEVDGSNVATYEEWLESLNYSLDKAYGLVEVLDSSVTPSQDIDSATLSGKITFLIQTNKLANLDYFVTKLRNEYLGNPQEVINGNGDKLTAYIGIGIILYDTEPEMTNVGETCVVSLNFSFTYLNNALNYSDTTIKFSSDDSTYYEIPLTKATFQNIPTSTSVPKMGRPDLTGVITSSWTKVCTFSFFDFNKDFTKWLNTKFWTISANSIDNVSTTTQEVNIVVWLKITSDGHTYKYKMKLDNLEKVVSNGDFNICSMVLKTWGKD